MSALLGTLAGLLLSGGLSTVVARGLVPPAAPSRLALRCVTWGVADTSWREEQLRQAAHAPMPAVGYWTPGTMADVVARAAEEQAMRRVYEPMHAKHIIAVRAPRAADVLAQQWRWIGRPPVDGRRVPGATLVGAVAA